MPVLMLLLLVVLCALAAVWWLVAAVATVLTFIGTSLGAGLALAVKLIPLPKGWRPIEVPNPAHQTAVVWRAFVGAWMAALQKYDARSNSPEAKARMAQRDAKAAHMLSLRQQAWDQSMRDHMANPVMHPAKPRKPRPTTQYPGRGHL
jgi:hypothetical protein